MRAALDTNVIASSLRNPSGTPGSILVALTRRDFQLVTSPLLRAELAEVLSRPSLMALLKWTSKDVDAFLNGLHVDALNTEPDLHISASRDPDDNRVLEAAVAGEADYIVTGDRDLLDLGEYEGIRILRPFEFLALLRSEQS